MAISTTAREAIQPLSNHFVDLLERIKPTQDRLEAAERFPDLVRDELRRTKLITTKDPHSRLSGSYGRQVAIKRIKDVDILIIVDDGYHVLSPDRVLHDLEAAAQSLPDALEMPGQIELREQRRSVRVRFTEADFDIDLVPTVAFGALDAELKVPDREWKQWCATRPLQYAGLVSELNQRGDRNLKRLIRLMKHWREYRDLDQDKRVKSFWLECLIVDAVLAGRIPLASRSLADVVADCFDAIYASCVTALAGSGTPWVADPVIPTNNVAFNWERAKFEVFMAQLAESRAQAHLAVAAMTKDGAVAAWQAAFGAEWFPADGSKRLNTAMTFGSASLVGPAVAAGRAGSGATIPAGAPVVAARPHRFYGTPPTDGEGR
jgi:hypothetical protein